VGGRVAREGLAFFPAQKMPVCLIILLMKIRFVVVAQTYPFLTIDKKNYFMVDSLDFVWFQLQLIFPIFKYWNFENLHPEWYQIDFFFAYPLNFDTRKFAQHQPKFWIYMIKNFKIGLELQDFIYLWIWSAQLDKSLWKKLPEPLQLSQLDWLSIGTIYSAPQDYMIFD